MSTAVRDTIAAATKSAIADLLAAEYGETTLAVREVPDSMYPPTSMATWRIPVATPATFFAEEPPDEPPSPVCAYVDLQRRVFRTPWKDLFVWSGRNQRTGAVYFAVRPIPWNQEPAR